MAQVLPAGTPGEWAIYDEDGNAAVTFDSFVACTVKAEHKIAQSPVERGEFADYNKEASPRSLGVILARTGPSDDLAATLDELDALVAGTDLLSVVTPERTFIDFNLASYDYDRKAENGIDRLLVSLTFEEIRQVDPEYSDEQIPAPKQPADGGTRAAGKQPAAQADSKTQGRVWKKHDSLASKAVS